jgi:hypothetical protein
MTLDRDARLRAGPHVHARAFENELVLLDLDAGSYYGLDELGAKLWVGVTGGKSPIEVANELKGVYAVDPETLVNDLVALADELTRRGLLVRVP